MVIPDPSQKQFLFIGILCLAAVAIAGISVAIPSLLTSLFRLGRPNTVKLAPYECGITPTGSARVRFPIKFYVVAMLFILFDIETIFLYPWAVVQRWLGVFGLIEMAIFVAILLVGYVYVWKRGAFQWDR